MKPVVPLRRYLLMQFAIVAALPVVIISMLAWQFLIPQMRRTINLQQRSLAVAIAGQISMHLMGGQRDLTALADYLSAGSITLSPAASTALMDALCSDGALFETIFTIRDGETTIHSVGLAKSRRYKREDLLGLDISGRRFLDLAWRAKKPVWSETFLSTVSGRLAVALTVPMQGGVIVGELALDQLSATIRHLPVEAGLFTLVLDGQGRIVADSQQNRWGQILDMHGLLKNDGGGPDGASSMPFRLGGVSQLGTVVPVDRLGWRVLVAQPFDNAFKSVRNAFLLIVVGLAVSLVTALVIAWQRAGNLSRIVNAYAVRARSIAEGDYEHTWPASQTAEFEHLGDNLRTMARTIRRREDQLMESEKQLRNLVTNIPGVVFQFTASPDRPEDGLFMSIAREKTREILGLEAHPETFHKAFTACVHPEDRERFVQSISDALNHVAPWDFEGRFVKPAGDEIWLSGRSVPHRMSGRTVYFGVLMDITRRKRLEESLRLTQFCFDKAAIGIFQIDKQGRILSVNEHGCRSLGYDPETLCGMTVFDIDPEFPSDRWPRHIARLQRRRSMTVETRHRRRDGTLFPVQIMINLMAFEGRELHVAFVQDISERKRWERELQASEGRYRSLFEEAPMMYVVTDNSTRQPIIRDVNRMFMDGLGYHREELLGTPLDDYYTPAARQSFLEDGCFQRVLSGQFVTTERDLLTRNQRVVHTLLHAVPDVGRNGEVIGARAMFLDITDRRQALEELQRLRQYLANIIDSMPSLLVGVDTTGRVTQWNLQAEKATGVTSARARGRPLAAVFPRLESEMARIRKAIRNREVIRKTKIPRQDDGATRFEDVTIFPLVTNGVDGAVLRVDDVTDRVRLEEMMVQSEKMLSVGGLAAGMAHEINNPLAGILQSVAVLQSRLIEDMPANRNAAAVAGTSLEAIGRYLELRKLSVMIGNIRDSGNRAADIVKNMLSFVRKSDRRISSHDLGELLDQTLELVGTDYDMKKHYDFKRIEVVRQYADDAAVVPCEAGKIQQVFLNILKNGAEAMAEKPSDRGARFVLKVNREPEWVRVEIEDNGPGMDAATRRRVFEPFFTTKPVGRGTGLGLSVSYFIITEDHGGQMHVEPAEGGGTRFVIRLPVTPDRSGAAAVDGRPAS